MKKNYLFLLSALLGASVLLSSCSDSDDNSSVINDETVVKNDNEAFALVNGAFQPFQKNGSIWTELSDVATEYGSSYFGNEDDDVIRTARLTYDQTNNYPVKMWYNGYWAIGIVNDAIEKISVSTQVSDAAKKEAIARAKFIRGLAYSYLVLYFGEVPLRLTANDANTTRVAIDDVYNQVIADLTAAEADLPSKTSTPVTISRGAAQALLARVYLQWASNPLSLEQVEAIKSSKTDPAASYDTNKLQKALEYAQKVIDSGNYDLVSKFENIFGRANESRAPEHIFTIHHDGDGIDIMGNHQSHCAWTYPFDTEKVSHIHPISTFDEWPDDDPRKAFSIVTSIKDPETGITYSYLPPETLPVFGKGVDRSYPNAEYETILLNDVDQIEIRYAEVLLEAAEALVFLNRADEAKPLINKVRERAYGDKSHDLETVTLENIQNEWQYEFVYERKHWQNLVRWRTLISTLKSVTKNELYKDLYAVEGTITPDGKKVSGHAARSHSILHSKYENAIGKLYRYPIPNGVEGEDLGVRPQNPGY